MELANTGHKGGPAGSIDLALDGLPGCIFAQASGIGEFCFSNLQASAAVNSHGPDLPPAIGFSHLDYNSKFLFLPCIPLFPGDAEAGNFRSQMATSRSEG